MTAGRLLKWIRDFPRKGKIPILRSIFDGDDTLGVYLRRRYALDAWAKDFSSRVMRLKSPWEGLIGRGDEFPIQLVD